MKSLLLVIDMQKGWLHRTASNEVMQDVARLCRRYSGDTIHCCFRNDPKTLFHTQLQWYRFTDSPDIDQIPEIAELNLPIYWRHTYSCVTDELLPVLQKYDHIYICGVFTDISVAATAMDIFDHNIPVSVVADHIATLHGDDVHVAALKSLGQAIGNRHLITGEAFLEEANPATSRANK